MAVKPRSLREEQRRHAAELRLTGRTWVEVAQCFAERYKVNMRVALRLAKGWSQRDAADRWNDRWPAIPRTFKNFSTWELWPATTGHAPSLDVLARLAELYDCSVADLISDGVRFDHQDSAARARRHLTALELTSLVTVQSPDHVPGDGLGQGFALANRMTVEELADAVAVWSTAADSTTDRRALALKLSTAFALAAGRSGSHEADDAPKRARQPLAGMAGVWDSRYLYHSASRGQEFEGRHYVVMREHGDQLVGQSVPHTTGSQLEIALSINSAIATGTWTERTSATGHYRGAVFHGTVQLVVNPMGRQMVGKWLGFGGNFKVNTGEWTLSWVDDATSTRAIRAYHLKA